MPEVRTENRLGGCDMDTITRQFEQIKAQICDDYCKWLEIFMEIEQDPDEAYERLLNEKCADCPLQKL